MYKSRNIFVFYKHFSYSKRKDKKQIKEEKLITEFIGKLASYMFMKKANDLVEKLVFPLHVDDEYDCGKMKELDSQLNMFQGSLSKFNHIMNSPVGQ